MAIRLSLVFLFFAVSALAQSSTAVAESASQASTLLARALASSTGSVSVTNVSIQGNTMRVIGETVDNGTISLIARPKQGRVDWQVGGGTRSIVLNSSLEGAPSCWWVDRNGQKREFAEHNCLIGQTWFSPSLTIMQSLLPNHQYEYLGSTSIDGQPLERVRSWMTISRGSASTAKLLRRLSTVDFYMDSSTGLLSILRFSTYPENDENIEIPVEIRYSDYRRVQGVLAPLRIQRWQNGNLLYDISVSSVAVNSGVDPNQFKAQ